jgi:hypothetical protein
MYRKAQSVHVGRMWERVRRRFAVGGACNAHSGVTNTKRVADRLE